MLDNEAICEQVNLIDGRDEDCSYGWNVIDDAAFKKRVRKVFTMVSDALIKTLGPYGATSIIEKFGDMHFTKDGWQLVKKINFADPTNNSILHLLLSISAQVVIKVGDGSTSSMVSANNILSKIENDDRLKSLRPKDLLDLMSSVVKMISDIIQEDAVKINKIDDPDFNEIKKLASISTNGDKKIAKIIQDIYKQTNNPSIEYSQSKTNETSYEIIEGYKIPFMTYLDRIFINDDGGDCIMTKPYILLFDHKLDKETHLTTIIQEAVQVALQNERRLLIIAPHYDKFLLDYIGSVLNHEFKARGTTTVVYGRISLLNNLSHEFYNDFAVMCGATVVKEAALEDLTNKVVKIDEFLGEVDKLFMGADATLIKGFYKRDENLYKSLIQDAQDKYRKVEEKHRELNIVNMELYNLKQRLSKLFGVMGVIHVGGNSSLEKAGNLDLVEDAVKACESAYNYGYNIGGNLVIPIAIDKILKNDVENKLSAASKTLLLHFREAFTDVFKLVLLNKYKEGNDPFNLQEIINKCIKNETCYNLITDEYSKDIINSCRTDIEILNAATSIVGLLISSNQFVSIMTKE